MVSTRSPYASPRLIRFVAAAVALVGLGVAIGGVAYWINGITHAGAEVVVPVEFVHPPAVPVPGFTLPAGARVEAGGDSLVLRAADSSVPEQLLARGDGAVLGLCLGLGGLLLRRLLLSIAAGRPFEPGNARRLAGIAALVAVGGTLAGMLPSVATLLVTHRLGLPGPGSPFETSVYVPLLPLAVTPVVLALAEAFRRGTELASDVDGLV